MADGRSESRLELGFISNDAHAPADPHYARDRRLRVRRQRVHLHHRRPTCGPAP